MSTYSSSRDSGSDNEIEDDETRRNLERLKEEIYRIAKSGTNYERVDIIEAVLRYDTISDDEAWDEPPSKKRRLGNDFMTIKFLDYTSSVKKLNGLIFYATAIRFPSDTDLINRLIDLGCNINIRDWTRRTVMHRLKERGDKTGSYLKLAELLIKRGIKLDVLSSIGESALETAVRRNEDDMAILLMRNGASLKSKHHQTVAHFAFVLGHSKILNAIIKFCLVQELQGKKVDEQVMEYIRMEEVRELYEWCLNDLNLLKHRIVKTNVMIHDVLKASKTTAVTYMRNNYVLMGVDRFLMQSVDFCYDIQQVRDEALKRINLEDAAVVKFKNLFKLPRMCSEIIFSHLEDEELDSFLRA